MHLAFFLFPAVHDHTRKAGSRSWKHFSALCICDSENPSMKKSITCIEALYLRSLRPHSEVLQHFPWIASEMLSCFFCILLTFKIVSFQLFLFLLVSTARCKLSLMDFQKVRFLPFLFSPHRETLNQYCYIRTQSSKGQTFVGGCLESFGPFTL